MILYIAVTFDKFELPLFVCDTREEMAEWYGVSPTTVATLCSRNNNKPPTKNVPKKARIRLRRVVIEEDGLNDSI